MAACRRCLGASDPRLFAICATGSCDVIDLSQSELSRCATETDCVVVRASCDPCEDDAPPAAIHSGSERAFVAALCTRAPPRTCENGHVPRVDDWGAAICNAGHCALPWMVTPSGL
jgi:hypothetical protein